MSKLFVDLSDKPDDFQIILLPTSYSTSYRIRTRIFKKYTDISIYYYNGLTKIYKSVKASLNCDVNVEEEKLKNSITDFIKITDTFTILKQDLTKDIIDKFRWSQQITEYAEQDLPIDPYILGLWLGDGDSNGINLTSIDKVLIEYWYNYAEKNNLNIKLNNKKERVNEIKEGETDKLYAYRISGINNKKGCNLILSEFKKLNLINNKHIPEIFLKNSVQNRLKLLAGLIDTDGYLDKNSRYEIIQKNKTLSDNIVSLATSLGFFTTINIKKAYAANTELKIVRDYYRMNIYINQINLEIPILLERKKLNCKDKQQYHNPKILINNTKLSKRIEWTDELDILLKECVKHYRSPKGKQLVPWKLIQQEIEDFNEFSHEALRARFQLIKNS
jgi:hypothetical protein